MKNFLRFLKRTVHQATSPGSVFTSRAQVERQRLAALPRYVETTSSLPGFDFKMPDGPSFLASWIEIFEKEIYHFKTSNPAPRILDCGANIGVSCLFLKRHYPHARITAFEPDPRIFAYLKHNLTVAGHADVELIPKAVWRAETTLSFHSEGADGGRIENAPQLANTQIQAVRLWDYLAEPVDLLKIDIEGAETEVLLDAVPRLGNVQNLFVEYHSFVGQPQRLDELFQLLRQAGFRLQVQPMRYALHPFLQDDPATTIDLQLNIFAFRV